MSSQQHSKIQSAVLITSVAIIAMVIGIVLDEKVIPEKNKPLTMEEEVVKEEDQARRDEQIEELEKQTKSTVAKAENLTKRAEQLISKTDISKPKVTEQSMPENKNRTERLADLRGRLDAIKK